MTITTEARDLAYFAATLTPSVREAAGALVAAVTYGNLAVLIDREDWDAFVMAVGEADHEIEQAVPR